jgi:hypothetical protein
MTFLVNYKALNRKDKIFLLPLLRFFDLSGHFDAQAHEPLGLAQHEPIDRW